MIKKRIFISGKITGEDLQASRIKFGVAETYLRTLYYDPINPMKICEYKPDKKHSEYMKECLRSLLTCHAIYMLKDWKFSEGATVECVVAETIGLEMIFEK